MLISIIHVVLLPIKIFISLIVRFCWYPSYVVDFSKFDKVASYGVSDPDINKWLYDGDGLKFIGMYCYATGNNWEEVLSFIDNDGNLYRTPKHEEMINFPVVSGDMLVGLLLACVRRLEDKKDIPEKVHRVFYKILEEGWPLKIKHPCKKDFSRGFIFTPWEPVYGASLSTSAFCDVAYAVTGDTKFKNVERVVRFINYPISFNSDYSFWVGRFKFKTWYIEHSKALLALAGWSVCEKDCEKYRYETFVKRLAERYYFNVDVVGVYAVVSSLEKNEPFVNDAFTIYGNLLHTVDCTSIPKIKNYTLRNFKTAVDYKYIIPPYCRKGQKHIWESTPLACCDNNEYDGLTLAFTEKLHQTINRKK